MAEKVISKKGDPQSEQKIIDNFQQLRMEQRNIANKIAELKSEISEHQIVMETMRKFEPDRKCFRAVGGVLVERTVKDVLPALEHNSEQLGVIVVKLTEQLTKKGEDLNSYRLKHNIQIREEGGQQPQETKGSAEATTSEPTPQGVLIS